MELPSIFNGWIAWLSSRPRASAIALALLCLAAYLPGVVRLPAIDRTEVIYAETTRDMVARGHWFDPRYDGQVQAYRPIGTFWAQAVSSSLAGTAHARDISVYRLPSLIAVTLAVLALYWLARPMIGSSAALIASGLFAVAPLTALLGTLGIAESLSLLPATVAMLTLLRIYVAERDDDTRTLAYLFWAALGFGILVNALLVPILVLTTLIALRFMDRDLWWLDRLHAVRGLPLALTIAAPWLIVRGYQDGVPFSGLSWHGVIRALGGAQDMKLRAWPGTFVLALGLGYLPGTALIVPALSRLWNQRTEKLARFLIAWVLGYLVYLELLSSKPGTYMVQVMFPALAIAVGMLIVREDGKSLPLKMSLIPWPPLAALFPVALFAPIYFLTRETPSLVALLCIAAVAALFWISAGEGRSGRLKSWAGTGIAALALFAITLTSVVLPGIEKIWPAQQLQTFVERSCDPGTSAGLLGFREPSTRFVMQIDPALQSAEALAKAYPDVQIVESRWLDRYALAMAAQGRVVGGTQYACIETFNVMRGCPMTFLVMGKQGGDRCFVQSCSAKTLVRAEGSPCD